MVGFCTLEGKPHKRAAKATYSAEEFITLTKIINTKIVDEKWK
jgi:CRISPR-associated endonuclease Csn1